MRTILIASNADESAILTQALARASITTQTFQSVEHALRVFEEKPADLWVVAVPATSTMPIVRALRKDSIIPIVVISDPLPEEEQIRLYTEGTDLVAIRPYSPRVLMAQANILVRRGNSMPFNALGKSICGPVELDPATRTARIHAGTPIRLTNLEFTLFHTLLVNDGNVVASETLIERVWGYADRGDRELLRNLVNRLRNKIEGPTSSGRLIHTVQSVGYRFDSET